jgi:hypothetical protein
MKLHDSDHRASLPIEKVRRYFPESVVLLLLTLTVLWQPAIAQQPDTSLIAKCAPLSAPEVIQNLVRMNLRRVHALHTYQGTRTYQVEYRGFPGARSAQMVVDVKYRSPGTKELVIQSATGSKLIIDRVLKKLLEAEIEAQDPEIQRHTALSEDNYFFTLIGCEDGSSGAAYLLKAEPRRMDKFLYRGRIWVDAEDFAVTKLEAEPARNPSFWTKKTEIEQVYVKVSDFWLPAHNHSATDIRLGGHADLTIDYRGYEITGANQVSGLSMPRSKSARQGVVPDEKQLNDIR